MTGVPKLRTVMLCGTFVVQAARIWDDLEASQSLGITRDEETITNDLLLTVQKAHPYEVLTFQFRKPEEKVTGADWEWWLTDGRLWLGLLIQAKRLDPKSHKYKSIKHKVGKDHVRQIDLLIDQARSKRIHPLYFFYNYSPSGLSAFSWHCGGTAPDLPQLGCTVAHAVAVDRALRQGGAGLPKMSEVSLPMKCLVCCPIWVDPDDSLPGRANGIANRLRGLAESGAELDGPYNPTPRPDPPAYVRQLLATSPEDRGRGIERMRQEVGPIGTLVVIKERHEREA